MSWITIVWSMNAAACLTLAGIYLLVWWKRREGWVHLLFSCSAAAAAAVAVFELAMMRTETTTQYAALLRWVPLPVSVLIVSLVVFVRLYLRAGRPWLAWSICALRIIVPILSFVFTPNLVYRAITSLRQVSWWGETVSVPVGIPNPWILISHMSLLLLIIFFVDATITVWRRGNRNRALVVGCSMIFFAAVVAGQVALVIWGIIYVPFFACFPYLGIVAVMAYELSNDVLRASQLAHALQESEAALRDTARHMELAANAGGIGMWTWDIARNEIWMTNKGRSLLGFSESEKLNAERVRSVVHPEDLELVRQAVERSLNTGEESEAECRVVLPDGQIRWITRRGRVEFNCDGKPTRMNGVWLDITERRLGEAALRDAEQRMKLAAAAAEIVMWTWDIPRDEVWLSDKDRTLFGFSPGEKLSAERIRSVVHPEDRELLRELVKNSLKTGEEIEAEYRVVLADGRVRWFTRRARMEFDRKGKPAWERGVLIDITERKLAEERFRLVVEAAPNAIIMANNEGRIILANTQAESLFGYAREELFDQPVEMLVPERLRSNHAGKRRSYFSNARPIGTGRDLLGRRKDGSEISIDIGLNPIHTSEGLCVLASIIDISERKLAELETARQRNALAHLSRVTMLGELSGSLAHELNQPLTAILSNAQAAQRFLAGDDVDLAEVREIISDIVAEDKRAGEIIRRLRLLLKKGEAQHHAGDIDINNVVQDVLRLMRNDFINQNVAVTTELGENLPAVTGDRIQLQQVILNLVLNACEAMTDCDSSECRLLIASKLENSAVHISVSDRGGSIPEEKMEHVFEPFFTTKAEGMGLGLSVCQSIIKAHRGKLWATNNADRGVTFHFSLPVGGQTETPITDSK
jgi:PAS domain S-box-containing protein